MNTLGLSPFTWLMFDEQGAIDPDVIRQLTALINTVGAGDLVVISHGWNNDQNDALRLYQNLWGNTCPNLPQGRAEKIVVAGVQWPAKAYRTDFDAAALTGTAQGGTLAGGHVASHSDLPAPLFEQILTDFEALMGESGAPAVAAAREAAQGLTATQSHQLVASGAAAVGMGSKPDDHELALDATPVVGAAAEPTRAQFLLGSLAAPPRLIVAPGVGAAQGLGDVINGLFSGPKAAAARFLNLLTYFEMKKRAGIVGLSLADKVLSPCRPERATRLHLVGHSFGGRLVTAAINQMGSPGNVELFSLTLLQGAFSHNALVTVVAPNVAGAFPSVVGKPTGPITITHTHNDQACTLAYALASRLSRDIAASIGDANDKFGAMGANGPQKLQPGTAEPDDTAETFRPKRGKVNTILADTFIVKTPTIDAHNNVANLQAGRLLAATIMA